MSFDTAQLIREVENRRIIWDISSEEYSDRMLKRKKWEEITNIMCKGKLKKHQKKEFGRILQQKWKNIRTSFTRELRRRTGSKSEAARKNPYTYFNQLQFLMEPVANSKMENSIDEIDVADANTEGDSARTHLPMGDGESDNLVDLLKQNIAMNKRRDKHEKEMESDSDRLFMFSLLQDFKKIPERHKLSTRMELIDVIKRAQILPVETHHYQLSVFRDGYSDYEETASLHSRKFTGRSYYGPKALGSKHHHNRTIEPNHKQGSRNTVHNPSEYSAPVSSKQNTITIYEEVISPTETAVSDVTQHTDIIELFQESVEDS